MPSIANARPIRYHHAVADRIHKRPVSLILLLGRTITAPLDWFPRLAHGDPDERTNYQLIAKGRGIHWPQLDEDISVQNLIEGRRSGECAESIAKWMAQRTCDSE